jgi:hypothetical protein
VRAKRSLSFAVLVLLGLSACAPALRPPPAGPGAPAAAAAVERFLQLAADGDFVEMGWVFGNERGPVIQQRPRAEVERWMHTLSQVLQHRTYSLRGESAIPGRMGKAVQIDVSLRTAEREHQVPFTAVQGPGGRWFVEQFDIERILSPR